MVAGIEPFDELETDHQIDIIGWINSQAPLCRISKPDNPPKHLVSYFILYDETNDLLLLIDHVKSKLLLPPGGHVEPGESPLTTVTREAEEELGVVARFDTMFGKKPLFVTVTMTNGHDHHIDVSLWYVIRGNSRELLAYDQREMNGYTWLSPVEILATPITLLDPQMHRFVRKMQKCRLEE